MMFGESRIKLIIAFVIASLFALIFSVAADTSSSPEAFNTLLLIKVYLILLILSILILGKNNVFIAIEIEKPIVVEEKQDEHANKIEIVGKEIAKALNRKEPLSEKEIEKVIDILDEYGL